MGARHPTRIATACGTPPKKNPLRGRIHSYYRMYWGKKIVEWSTPPKKPLPPCSISMTSTRWTLGSHVVGTPNSYANILWRFGLHGCPWGERIFGMAPYMARYRMDRKTGVQANRNQIECLERAGKELIT